MKADKSGAVISETLTKSTIERIQERFGEEDGGIGVSVDNGEARVDATEAVYEREEVEGPLKNANIRKEKTKRHWESGDATASEAAVSVFGYYIGRRIC